MNKIFIISRKEFLSVIRNRLFITIAVLFLTLSILSVYIGSTTKKAEMRVYNERITTLTQQGYSDLPAKPEIKTLTILFNLTEYVSIVGAILAVTLGYNTLINEKESGSLKLILSRPVYRDWLITGKILGNAAVIGILLILVFIFNIILLILVGGIIPTGIEVLRLSVFMVMAFFYMLIFLSLAILLSIRLTSSATVFFISLVLWMLFSFVIPQMAEAVKSNSTVINSITGTAYLLPQETTASRIINALSPVWHFRMIGSRLLEASSGSTTYTSGALIVSCLKTFLVLLAPTAVFITAGYASFLRNETLILE